MFTRDKLLKMKLIDNDCCLKCQQPESIEHLFFNCEYSATLWTEVEKWINSTGFLNYKVDNKITILGDRKKNFIINLI